jgi:hypothetical protein
VGVLHKGPGGAERSCPWHWFDSPGYPLETPARGGFDGDALALTRTSPRGANRTTFTLDGDRLRQHIAVDGTTLVSATYARR